MAKLDGRWRGKVHEETKKYERMEEEQMKELAEKNVVALEKAVGSLQTAYQEKIDQGKAVMEKEEAKEIGKLQGEGSVATDCEEKRVAYEREVGKLEKAASEDIEKYRAKREAEMEEQMNRAREQCRTDVEEYTARHKATTEKLLEQVKAKYELEVRNEEQTNKLTTTNKVNQIREKFAKSQAAETARLNDELTASIAKARKANEEEAVKQQATTKKTLQKELEDAQARLEADFKEERGKLEATIEELETAIKGNLKAEARDLARRRSMKAELLSMMAMDDMWRLTDEDLISRRHGFLIDRGAIIPAHCTASSIFAASKPVEERCYCKITLLSKWSFRHRADFNKYSTRLARYLTLNRQKAPNFVSIIEVFTTDSKVYTFMEPLKCTRTLAVHLESLRRSPKAKKSASKVTTGKDADGKRSMPTKRSSGLKKCETVHLLKEVSKAAAFLNNIFIAHCALTPDNLTIIPHSASNSSSSLSHCEVVITGLTRPIVYYNVESDCIIPVKGFEPPTTEDHLDLLIDHLPPECFQSEFVASGVDAYSIGILAYTFLRLGSPFSSVPRKKVLAAKQDASAADGLKLTLEEGAEEAEHRHLPSLVASLTTSLPSKRLPIEDIRQHAYFKH